MRNLILILALAICVAVNGQNSRSTTIKKTGVATQSAKPKTPATKSSNQTSRSKTQGTKNNDKYPVKVVSKVPAGKVLYEEVIFNITGTVHGYADGTVVKLCTPGDKGLVTRDSTIIHNGTFAFKGGCPNVPYMNFIVLGEGSDKTLVEVFLEKGNTKVDITAGKRIDKVSGTTHNNIYAPYRDSINAIYTDIYNCLVESNRLTNSEEERESYKAGADVLRQKIVDTSYEFTSRNLSNWVGMYLFAKYYRSFTLAQNKALLARVPQKYAQIPIMSSIRSYVKKQK